MQTLLSKKINFFGFLLLSVFLLSFVGSLFPTATTNAATQNNPVLLIRDHCQGVKDIDTRRNVSVDGANTCEQWQNIAKKELGCSGSLFYEHEFSDGSKKWYVKEGEYKSCWQSAQAQLNLIKNQCQKVLNDSDLWNKKCEANQNHLYESMGCSNKMFEDFKEGGEKYWRPVTTPDKLAQCQGQIDNVGTTKIIIIGPDGNPVANTNPISSDQVAAASADGGSGGGVDGASGESGTNCQGGPMGWLFCPMIDYMTGTLQLSARLIDDLMQIKFLAQEGSSNKIEEAWRAFLSIANILLVIAFMVIIFSQASSAGLNNYNVKRMLPRLIVAAILMNVSFYICALLIDVSNIAGASIMGLFIGENSISDTITAATGGDGGNGIIGGALGGALLIGFLVLILTPVVLSIIVVFVCLVARQLILICLVLAAPLAFVAWLLPNTEKWFKKWSQLLLQLLILYPVAMFIFGASLYFANFLGTGAQGGSGTTLGESDSILTQITQLIVLCIPLVALPMLIKSSASIMGTIGNYANKASAGTAGKLTDKLSAGAKARGVAYGKFGAYGATSGAKWAGRAAGSSRAAQWVGGRPGAGALSKGGRAVRTGVRGARAADKAILEASDARKLSKQADLQSAARQFAQGTPIAAFGGTAYAGAMSKAQKDLVDNARARIDAEIAPGDINTLRDALVEAVQSGNHTDARAITDRLSTTEGGRGVDTIRDAINSPQVQTSSTESREALAASIKANGKDVAGKGMDVVAWGGTGATSWAGLELKDSEVVGHTPAAIATARAAGSITPVQAARVQANPETNKDLNDAQRAALI